MSDLLYEVKDKIATITLNRPDKLNAFTGSMIDAWAGAPTEAQADDNVNVVIVTGAGRAFCSGGDVGRMRQGEPSAHDGKNSLWEGVHRVPKTLEAMDKPVIAMVNGLAVGAGMGMCVMCDMRVAADPDAHDQAPRLPEPAARPQNAPRPRLVAHVDRAPDGRPRRGRRRVQGEAVAEVPGALRPERGSSTIWVWMTRASRRPDASVTRVSHTMVVRPRWSGVEAARTVPSLAPAKKLVFDSSVVVEAPCGRLRNVAVAATVSARAMIVPPWSLPPIVLRSSRIASSATTRSVVASTKRMPSSSGRHPL